MFVRRDGLLLQIGIYGGLLVAEICPQCAHSGKEGVNLALESGYLGRHCPELVRVFEVCSAAVGGIDTLEGEIAAALARCLAVAFDFPSFALVASKKSVKSWVTACSQGRVPGYRDVAVALGPLLLGLAVVALPLAVAAATSGILLRCRRFHAGRHGLH